MFTLKVETTDLSFLDYLKVESKQETTTTYFFSSHVKAAEIISRYLLKQQIEKITDQLVKTHHLSSDAKKELYTYISNETLYKVLKTMEETLIAYLNEQPLFHLEGYRLFRLKNETGIIQQELDKAYDYFLDDGTSNTVYLKKVMEQQHTVEEELKLIVDATGIIQLIGRQKTYLHDVIEEDDCQGEDNAISHIVLMSPKQLKVYDPKDRLSKETVIILTKLFEEKVKFLREEYVSH